MRGGIDPCLSDVTYKGMQNLGVEQKLRGDGFGVDSGRRSSFVGGEWFLHSGDGVWGKWDDNI